MQTGKTPEPSAPAPEELPTAAFADRTKPRPARRYREPLDIDYSTKKTREELQDALPSTVFDWALGMQEMFFNVRNRLEQEQQALVKAKQDQESDHLWMDEQEERLGELEQSLKEQGRALDEERRAFDELQRAFQQELEEHRRGIEDGEGFEEERLGWDDRDNMDEEEHGPGDERGYVGLEEYDPDVEQCFPHDEPKFLQVTRRPEAYPPLSGICSQAEELMQSCRRGIKAKITRKQWEARRGRKITPFSYQGKAPTTAAFYTLFGLSDRNGPFVLRGRNITVEELEGRLRGTICKKACSPL
ncbi:hypothetical protein MPH_10070 [Macrophomina phaseolina MS6]|uniref:Uncharacterized protein n=1 Tax=Macrophomina phaseolina (strain MS6) TaxID=1126212 RepID=K2RIV8_MACPH|nr:hypothetical protein MPH_10070 [Macrophomina phaseolina MS6]